MRFWFEHSSEVPLRDQLATQVTLGILSGDLAPGERLPSIRALAIRYGLHPNTVSAGYRQHEAEGWVASRKGSGVFVKAANPTASRIHPEAALDRLLANLFDGARRFSIPTETLVAAVQSRATRSASLPARILLVEPDPELRNIVLAELSEATTLPATGCGFGEALAHLHTPALVLTLPSKLETIKSEFRATDTPVHALRIRSVPTSMSEWFPNNTVPVGPSALIGLASRWPEFLRFSRTMLVAAGLSPDALILRNPSQSNWQHGLDQTAAVLCDLLTARQLPHRNTIVFRILAETTPADLKAMRGNP